MNKNFIRTGSKTPSRIESPLDFLRNEGAGLHSWLRKLRVENKDLKVVGCGNTSGANIDKFERFSLTPQLAARVGAPLIEECFANLECQVADTSMVSKYCLFVLEVVKAWIDPSVKNPRTLHHLGKGNFMVAGEKIKLTSKKK